MRINSLFCALVLPFGLCQCSTLVHSDSVKMRGVALDYYDAQVMDNLIRASEGRLILHVDISTISANSKISSGGTLGGGRNRNSETSPLGLVTKTITRPFSWGLSGGIDGTVNLEAKPNVTSKEIYLAYVKFLCLQSPNTKLRDVQNVDFDPRSHIVSLVRMDPASKVDKTQIVKGTLAERDGVSYYVPLEYAKAYFDLCLALTGNLVLGEEPEERAGAKNSNSGGGNNTSASKRSKSKASYRELGPRTKPLDSAFQEAAKDEIKRLQIMQ